MLQSVLLAQIFTTFFMTGLIWLVQVVHYPLMADVGTDLFVEYEAKHTRTITFVVMPMMLVELGTAVSLLLLPSGFPRHWLIVAFGLLLLIWASTFFLQVPLHGVLSQKFDAISHQKLVNTNWVRTVLWSARSGIWLVLLYPKL
jgi:uncharacterized membrane protein